MKVREMMDRIDYLRRLKNELEEESKKDKTIIAGATLIEEAADAIDDYIDELMRKEVKV